MTEEENADDQVNPKRPKMEFESDGNFLSLVNCEF